jgi:arylsulfatase
VGRLLDFVDAAGLRATTLVAVTSDHGEGLGQHDSPEHGDLVYEEAVRVPLVLRGPGGLEAGRVWEESVTLLDLAPTLMGLMRLGDRPRSFHGRDLSAALGEEPGRTRHPATVFLRSELRTERCNHYAVRQGRWKYLEKRCQGTLRAAELYDLAADPGERHDLRAAARPEASRLSGLLLTWRRSRGQPAAAPSTADLEAFRALGYF